MLFVFLRFTITGAYSNKGGLREFPCVLDYCIRPDLPVHTRRRLYENFWYGCFHFTSTFGVVYTMWGKPWVSWLLAVLSGHN